jgi:RNA polymerase sigma-70 factor (ECF subfamily)
MTGPDRFLTTHWSVVRRAGHLASAECQAALSALCEQYWYALYAFIRRRGYDWHEAQDLTQAFFARLLEKGELRLADPERGRFRSFLLAALQHFLANEWDRRTAQKRGGGQTPLQLDLDTAEDRFRAEPAHADTPEKLFHRRWALMVLDRVLQRLRDDYQSSGRSQLFSRLEPLLVGERAANTGPVGYRDIGGELGMSESAVKTAIHRLRKRFRDTLREEIAQTVAAPEDIDDELRQLFQALESR